VFVLLTSVLASLNLPAAIEDLSGQTIPKSLLDKSAAVNEKGGLNAIDVLMQELPELLQRNREILDEVRKPSGTENSGVSLRVRHRVKAVRMILASWFDILEESRYKEVKLKKKLPACENELPSCLKRL